MIIEKKAPRFARYIFTSGGLNGNSNVTCDNCGKVFSSSSFANRYSSHGNIIILCPECAKSELEKGTVRRLIF